MYSVLTWQSTDFRKLGLLENCAPLKFSVAVFQEIQDEVLEVHFLVSIRGILEICMLSQYGIYSVVPSRSPELDARISEANQSHLWLVLV